MDDALYAQREVAAAITRALPAGLGLPGGQPLVTQRLPMSE